MLNKFAWLYLATIVVSSKASQRVLKDQTFLRLYSKPHTPRTQWVYRPQDDYRLTSEGISHGYASHPQGSALRATESSFDLSSYSTSSREHWKPSSFNTNYTAASYYGYSRPFVGSASSSGGLSYQDSLQGSHQYQQMRPAGGSYGFKKTPMYLMKGKPQFQSLDVSGRLKYKKTPLSSYKGVYPRVHKPYAKQKYPIQKTASYRRYYTSPYQRYSIAPSEILRFRVSSQGDHFKASTASPSLANKHQTTERMDDTYPDGSAPSEDYSAYNYTQNENQVNYYEVEEETERTTSDTEENSYDESTTRGYYGDRIYMSTQVPLITPDKTGVKNKYFIIRRTSDDDDDIETIFE